MKNITPGRQIPHNQEPRSRGFSTLGLGLWSEKRLEVLSFEYYLSRPHSCSTKLLPFGPVAMILSGQFVQVVLVLSWWVGHVLSSRVRLPVL